MQRLLQFGLRASLASQLGLALSFSPQSLEAVMHGATKFYLEMATVISAVVTAIATLVLAVRRPK